MKGFIEALQDSVVIASEHGHTDIGKDVGVVAGQLVRQAEEFGPLTWAAPDGRKLEIYVMEDKGVGGE